MDLSTDLVTGGSAVAALWVLVRGIGRWISARGDKDAAEAAQDTASAKAVVEMLSQMADLRKRVEALEGEVSEEREKRTAAEKYTAVLEERLAWAEKRGEIIAKELRAWHEAGRPTVQSVRPQPVAPKLPKVRF